MLTFVGLADNIAPFAQRKDLVKDALDNKSMRVVDYRDALHSFDQFTVATPITKSFGTFGHNEKGCDPIVVGTGGLPKEVTMAAYWAPPDGPRRREAAVPVRDS